MDSSNNEKREFIMGYRGIILVLILVLIAVSNNNTKWQEVADDHISELRDEVYWKDKEIEDLQKEIRELRYDYDDLRSILWDVVDYLEGN